MQRRVIAAVVVSAVFIGAALWFRISNNAPEELAVGTLERAAVETYFHDTIISDFTTPPSGGYTKPEDLTLTETIGRSLLTDYMGLGAANKQVSASDIIGLAERYAESIGTINQTTKINPLNLTIVPGTRENLEVYARAMRQTYTGHAVGVFKFYEDERRGVNATNGYASAKESGVAYESLGAAMEKMSVPTSVASAHLDLINIYYTNSLAMQSIGKANEDPIVGLAGTILITENLEKEELALGTIDRVFKLNNIIY